MQSRGRQRTREKVRRDVQDQLRLGRPTADVMRDVESAAGWRPSRATVYAWAAKVRAEREADDSGRWLLARSGKEVTRPDLVMRVQIAQQVEWWNEAMSQAPARRGPGAAETARVIAEATLAVPAPPPVSRADAEWISRLGGILPDPGSDRDALVRLLLLARSYVAAAALDDEKELALLDVEVAARAFTGKWEV